MSKITYALPAFAGHISTAERNRISKFFRKANRWHLVTQIFDIDTLIGTTDSRFFHSITYPDHCLNYLLPSKRNYTMQLRPKAHNFTLPHIHTTLLKTRLSTDAFLALHDYTYGRNLLLCTTLHCICICMNFFVHCIITLLVSTIYSLY